MKTGIYARFKISERNLISEILRLKADFAAMSAFLLPFWFFGGFRCGVPLFIVIRVIYKYKNR